MKRKMTVAIALLLALMALAMMTGCRWVKFPTFAETESIPLRGATTLTGEIIQSIGELTIRPSATPTDAVGAEFTYAPESWRPSVSRSFNTSDTGFRIESPRDGGNLPFGYTRNSWVITLPGGVMTDLSLELGVGRSVVDLTGIDLTHLRARTGVGDTSIDLSKIDMPINNVTVRIEAGVGNLVLRLPRTVPVRITTSEQGVGNLSAPGFIRNGDLITNGEFLMAAPTIQIELVRGVGNVTLQLID